VSCAIIKRTSCSVTTLSSLVSLLGTKKTISKKSVYTHYQDNQFEHQLYYFYNLGIADQTIHLQYLSIIILQNQQQKGREAPPNHRTLIFKDSANFPSRLVDESEYNNKSYFYDRNFDIVLFVLNYGRSCLLSLHLVCCFYAFSGRCRLDDSLQLEQENVRAAII
jgi:hypothetical protein